MSPKVDFSVVTPTYNRAHLIPDCLASVRKERNSTRFTVEHVIVDDGSTDDTEEVVKCWIDANQADWIRYIRLDRNQGVTAARNRGLDVARGEFLVLLDSDDLLISPAFDGIHEVFDRYPDVDIFFGAIELKSGKPQDAPSKLLERPLGFAEYSRAIRLGEHLPIVRHAALGGGMRYVAELKGFESILYSRILKGGGKLWIDPRKIRIYDNIGTDRICHPSKMSRDATRLFRGFIYQYREFESDLDRHAPDALHGLLVRLVWYMKLSPDVSSEDRKFVRSRLARGSWKAKLIGLTPAPLVRAFYRGLWLARTLRIS